MTQIRPKIQQNSRIPHYFGMVVCLLKIHADGKVYPLQIDNELSVSRLNEVISVICYF